MSLFLLDGFPDRLASKITTGSESSEIEPEPVYIPADDIDF